MTETNIVKQFVTDSILTAQYPEIEPDEQFVDETVKHFIDSPISGHLFEPRTIKRTEILNALKEHYQYALDAAHELIKDCGIEPTEAFTIEIALQEILTDALNESVQGAQAA